MTRRLYTSALPYANGPIHLGHIVEYVQTDIMVRARRLSGQDVLYVCADDTHGTPIELNARRQGITPEELVERSWHEHTRDFAGFHVGFDLYYTTNSPENEALAGMIYGRLRDGGHLERRRSLQFFSESLGRFLPDRMVRGTCPNCGAAEQYGDGCEVCKSTYEPTALKNPVDAIEGKTPVLRETEQIYVRLTDFEAFLRDWLPRGVSSEATRNYIQVWLDKGLEGWCISRDAPYFGFPIPGEPGKFFYVWLDAPVGYVAATKKYCDDRGLDWRQWWGQDADAHVTHVIGKDIVYFHTLFWPAMLHAAALRPPDHVQVHGFLTVNGKKMSKSRGTFIRAATYLDHLDPDYLRFYYAARLGDTAEDIDLHLEDFVGRVNADLVNNVVNLCSRASKFLLKRFDGVLRPLDGDEDALLERFVDYLPRVLECYERWDYRAAIRLVTELGNAANLYMQEQEPWKTAATDEEAAHEATTIAMYAGVALMTVLSPVVPATAARLAQTLGLAELPLSLTDPRNLPARVLEPATLLDRLDPQRVAAMTQDATADLVETDATTDAPAATGPALEPYKPEIAFDDFAKIDLRVGIVREASFVEGADKLLRLQVDIGKTIQVFAGVRKAYADPSVLVGTRVVVVANLAPRKMKFGVSEGMLLATSASDDTGLQLALLSPEIEAGWTVR